MRQRRHRAKQSVRNAAIAAALFGLSSVARAEASESVSTNDLQAAARTLGFVDAFQHSGELSIGVVYGGGDSAARDQAGQAAAQLARMPGPNSSSLRTTVIGAEDLVRGQSHFDVLYLMPGTAADEKAVSDFVRRSHVLSISNDPACIDARCCVLMIQTVPSVNIELNTSLANDVGAKFSSVFEMMVKRR